MKSSVVGLLEAVLDGNPQAILLLASVYALLACAYSLFHQLRMRRWPRVRGHLLDAGLVSISGGDLARWRQYYAGEAVYRYRVDGGHYRGRRISPWVSVDSFSARFVLARALRKISADQEGGVDVYYRPTNPGRSLLIRPGWVGIGLTAALGLAPLTLYISAYGIGR